MLRHVTLTIYDEMVYTIPLDISRFIAASLTLGLEVLRDSQTLQKAGHYRAEDGASIL
jgi:hypothetical protein